MQFNFQFGKANWQEGKEYLSHTVFYSFDVKSKGLYLVEDMYLLQILFSNILLLCYAI